MKKYIFTILAFTIITSCKPDPNKQVDEGTVTGNMYHSEEIGWTIEIPEGWRVTNRAVTQDMQDRGLEAIMEANGVEEYDVSGLKQLISFRKSRSHIFTATSEKFELEYEGEYEDNQKYLKEILYNTYVNNGIRVDTTSSKEVIDDLQFNLFHITVYDAQGNIILYQDLYSRYMNGLDFGVTLNYINEKEKNELKKVWRNSKFD